MSISNTVYYSMDQHEQKTPQPLPFARQSKRLAFLSLLLVWVYGIPGLILGFIAISKSKKAVALHTSEPELYDPSSLQDIMIARIAAMIGLIFSGLCLFYFTAMLFLQGEFFPF